MFLLAETCNQTIIPLVKKLCKTFLRSKSVPLPGVAHQLGPFCTGLSPRLAAEHGHWFLEIFKLFCKVGKDDEDFSSVENSNSEGVSIKNKSKTSRKSANSIY